MLIRETQMWRSTYDGILKEDISEGFISASVTMDPENDQTWIMDAVLTWEGWQAIDPYYDWLVPVLIMTYPDGSVRQGRLGRYMVLDSPETHSELTASVKLECADPLWMVARSSTSDIFSVDKGGRKSRAIQKLIDSVVLTDSPTGRRMYAIPDDDEVFKHDREWDQDTSKLQICNDIAQGVGFFPLFTTKHGIITTHRRGAARLRNKTPVRTFSANLPAGMVLDRHDRPLGGLLSEVAGVIQTTPKGQDLINEILMVNDDPDTGNLHVRGKITHPDNPRSVFHSKGRKHTKKIKHPVLDDDATAKEVAEALLDELSTKNKTIKLDVVPDPEPEYVRETVNVLVWNTHGDKVANGQYAIHRIAWGLTKTSATMTMDLGRIDRADNVEDIDN